MSASDVSSVPIVTNQSHPLFVDPSLRGPDSKAAPSRTRQAPAASIHLRLQSQCPTPLRAGLLGPRVVSPHPQGLQGSHLNLS